MKQHKMPSIEVMYPWVCTDASNDQWGRFFGNGVYEFREGNFSERIDIKEFSEKEMNYEVEGYYNSLEELKEIYGDEWEWIVAECIFENMVPPVPPKN